MDMSKALDAIVEVAQQRPFQADAISARLGVAVREASSSNRFFTVYRGTSDDGAVAGLEVRQPAASDKGGLVRVSLRGECVTEDAVGDRFGAPAPGPLSIPDPRAPADTPRYRVHPQPWGAVRLGYDPESGCLREVVLDAT